MAQDSESRAQGSLAGKKILLGVSGGIACYKVIQVARDLTQLGAEVHVAMTHAAQEFVGPLTFETLTGNKVLTNVMELDGDSDIVHVELGKSVDVIVVAPATANIIGRIAYGLAEDPITVTMLASPAAVLIVPAMDHHMWENEATQANIETLRQRGMRILPPLRGALASGAIGWGRMQEPGAIVEALRRHFEPGPLAGKHLVVTAGGTREPIDPVRYIGNRSSGKMGVALAEAAAQRGAKVTLVYGAISTALPQGIEARHTPTADEMAHAVKKLAAKADVLIMAAAVADYKASSIAKHKIKKPTAPADSSLDARNDKRGAILRSAQNDMTGDTRNDKADSALRLTLKPTVDILASIAGLPLVKVGFAAETQGLVESAREKLKRKKLDLVVGNNVTAAGSGFGSDTNQVVLVARDGSAEELPLLGKREVAERVLDRVQALLAERG